MNHPSTTTDFPIASVSNLSMTLDGIRQRMDIEEDILFLYLTSHGSEDHVLSIDLGRLNLNQMSADDLRRVIDRSGIKWKVVVVSACFSGGFIDALKDDTTIVMTAARHDRTSFGCGNEDEFTYFGRAYFDDALRSGLPILAAFDEAKRLIKAKEMAESLTPSEPQIYIGPALKAKLSELNNGSPGQGPTQNLSEQVLDFDIHPDTDNEPASFSDPQVPVYRLNR